MRQILNSVRATFLLATALSTASQADITEIPAEELTEEYIRDTTVLVPVAQPAAPRTKVNARVRASEAPYSESDNAQQAIANDHGVLLPTDMSEQTQLQLQYSLSRQFDNPALDPNLAQSEQFLRNALNLPSGQPIDLDSLSFPTNIIPDQNLSNGLGYLLTPGQLTISIPNNHQYPERNYSTPGGEYNINVTDQRIEFTLDINAGRQ